MTDDLTIEPIDYFDNTNNQNEIIEVNNEPKEFIKDDDYYNRVPRRKRTIIKSDNG